MSSADDIGLNPYETGGFSNFSVANGLAGGTVVANGGSADSAVTFLHRGYWGILNPGKTGLRYPIDTSKYRKLAFRMSSGVSGEIPQVFWFHHPWTDPAEAGPGTKALENTAVGFKTWVTDLTQGNAGPAWASGVVRGFRIDPNNHSVGYDAYFDWVRLTAADNAPGSAMMNIQWTGVSSATLEVIDAGGTVLQIAASANSPYSFNYGILPPGSYTLRVRNGGTQATSTFRINTPPGIRVLSPSFTSGEDFATTVIGNPWDMDSPADVPAVGNITSVSFSGGEMHGVNTNADPSVGILWHANNSIPIDTSKYRYLTYRFRVDGAFDMGAGSVVRLFWSSAQDMVPSTATTSKDILIWPGTNSYTIDLATLTAASNGGLEPTGAAEIWTAGSKRLLRIDPHEFTETRVFHFDDVKLTAKPESTGSFNIGFTANDLDGDFTTVALYYDTDRDPNNGLTRIGTVAAAAGSFNWNTAGVAAGEYYIYAEANDGLQALGNYSEAVVRVSVSAPVAEPMMSIDSPGPGATVRQPFVFGGWAIDRAAGSGTGVDTVHVYAQPAGGSPVFVGVAQYGVARGDIGGAFGSRFTGSGYNVGVNGLAPGNYTLTAYAHSTFSGTFNQSRSVSITIPQGGSSPVLSIDAPGNGATVSQPFVVGGWAVDRGATSGSGVSAVHVYAFPNPGSGAAPIFLGAASYGGSRGDVAGIFGAQFGGSGFNLNVAGLGSGRYRISAYALSTVTGAFAIQTSVDVQVTAPSSIPMMGVDGPPSGSNVSGAFVIGGWAGDLGSASGSGVDAVHVWAYPVGAAPFFVGVATYGGARSDVAAAYGQRLLYSGWGIVVPALPRGTYDFTVFAHSTVAGTFNQTRQIRISVP